MAGPAKITDDHIRKVIRAEIAEKYPEHSEALEKIMGFLIMSARKRIERVTSRVSDADPDSLIGFDIQDIVNQREKELAYQKYCDFMEEEKQEAIEFKDFKKGNGGSQSAYNLFLHLSEMGIKSGDRVIDSEGNEYLVEKISNKCRPVLVDKEGNKKNNQNLIGFEKISG